MPKSKLKIPFKPRKHQKEIIHNLKKFNVLVCHRRFGKTALSVNLLIKQAIEKPNQYCAYIAPTLKQAKIVAWHSPHTSFKKYLRPLIDAGLVKAYETESRIEFWNGSMISLFGVDDPERLRGIGLNAVVLDEVVRIKPIVWSQIISPTIEDDGWAIFISTPKGQNNLFYDLFQLAEREENEEWYSAVYKASETGILSEKKLNNEKLTMLEDEYEQEYECSFLAAIIGSYYGTIINQLRRDKHVGKYPWRPDKLVYTTWDLGRDDSTSIWFYQKDHSGIFLIEYFEDSDEPIQYYLKFCKEKPYTYGKFYFPHDIKVTDYSSEKSRFRIVKDFGFQPVIVSKKISPEEGINKVRTLLPRCFFDEDKCSYGIDALTEYRKDINEKLTVKGRNIVYKDHPIHDWTSHAADAFRYLAVSYKEPGPKKKPKKRKEKYKIFDK